MHARGAGFDHLPHDFVGVEWPAKSGFRVGENGYIPIDGFGLIFEYRDLISSLKSLVDAAHQGRHAVGGIQALIGIHLAGQVGVGRHLPAADVDRFQPGTDLLNRLVSSEGAQSVHVSFCVHQIPEVLRAAAGQRVFHRHGAAITDHLLRRVRPFYTLPSGVLGPVSLQRFHRTLAQARR